VTGERSTPSDARSDTPEVEGPASGGRSNGRYSESKRSSIKIRRHSTTYDTIYKTPRRTKKNRVDNNNVELRAEIGGPREL
jgi:hypothetical protein